MAPAEIPAEKAAPLNAEGGSPPVLVHVTAPATLPAGYTFEAQLNEDPERTFTVEVVSLFCCGLDEFVDLGRNLTLSLFSPKAVSPKDKSSWLLCRTT